LNGTGNISPNSQVRVRQDINTKKNNLLVSDSSEKTTLKNFLKILSVQKTEKIVNITILKCSKRNIYINIRNGNSVTVIKSSDYDSLFLL